jgi:DNA-binding GntR family transcriptional regulator
VSLRNQIVDALREEILTDRLKPGTVLLERECASRFGVSKTPVREALSLLVHEGLVELLPRRGYLVSSITVRDAQDDFELRVILEGAAAESAARKLTDEQLRQLEGLAEADDPREGVGRMLDRNFAFHALIARASGNARLAILIERLIRGTTRLVTLGFVPGEHARLMRALRERDPSRARAAMEDHIRTVREQALTGAVAPESPFGSR